MNNEDITIQGEKLFDFVSRSGDIDRLLGSKGLSDAECCAIKDAACFFCKNTRAHAGTLSNGRPVCEGCAIAVDAIRTVPPDLEVA